ncbi:MAG TPA: hypothetical protein VFU10_06570, partial [Gaiellaceae bacterium]|nr:hypothetical protein [Gaiellaceae bacterium]
GLGRRNLNLNIRAPPGWGRSSVVPKDSSGGCLFPGDGDARPNRSCPVSRPASEAARRWIDRRGRADDLAERRQLIAEAPLAYEWREGRIFEVRKLPSTLAPGPPAPAQVQPRHSSMRKLA